MRRSDTTMCPLCAHTIVTTNSGWDFLCPNCLAVGVRGVISPPYRPWEGEPYWMVWSLGNILDEAQPLRRDVRPLTNEKE